MQLSIANIPPSDYRFENGQLILLHGPSDVILKFGDPAVKVTITGIQYSYPRITTFPSKMLIKSSSFNVGDKLKVNNDVFECKVKGEIEIDIKSLLDITAEYISPPYSIYYNIAGLPAGSWEVTGKIASVPKLKFTATNDFPANAYVNAKLTVEEIPLKPSIVGKVLTLTGDLPTEVTNDWIIIGEYKLPFKLTAIKNGTKYTLISGRFIPGTEVTKTFGTTLYPTTGHFELINSTVDAYYITIQAINNTWAITVSNTDVDAIDITVEYKDSAARNLNLMSNLKCFYNSLTDKIYVELGESINKLYIYAHSGPNISQFPVYSFDITIVDGIATIDASQIADAYGALYVCRQDVVSDNAKTEYYQLKIDDCKLSITNKVFMVKFENVGYWQKTISTLDESIVYANDTFTWASGIDVGAITIVY